MTSHNAGTKARALRATLNTASRAAHPGVGRFAALQTLTMALPCLRFAPGVPSRYRARAIAGPQSWMDALGLARITASRWKSDS